MAEDVSQEAFLSIWRSKLRYQADRGSVRTWVLGIVHHRAIDALRRNTVHDKRRASAEGIEERFEARERTDVEAARRDEALTVRSRARGAPRRAVPGDRAGLLRRLLAQPDRRPAGHADRHRQGAHAPRPGQAAQDPARTTGSGSARRTQRTLIAAEVALAVMLLIGGGVLLRSFARLNSVSLGFDRVHTLTAELFLPEAKYGELATTRMFFRDAVARVAQLPGVTAAGGVLLRPLAGPDGFDYPLSLEGTNAERSAVSRS